jgi:hypothetical protein
VRLAVESGAALAGTLQTENVGLEKVLCNLVSNLNIRHLITFGPESPGHLVGNAIASQFQNGVDDRKRILGTKAPTPYLFNVPMEFIDRTREQVTEPLLTCEPVLAEAAFHLQNVSLVLELIREGLVTPSFNCCDHLPQLEALAARYADRHPDLADLCLIRMSELFPRHSIITVDQEDFRVYRRNKREAIPLICPPKS